MRKKMYWGIASLFLIIGVVGVFFMLQPDSDTEPDQRYIVPSEAELKNAREARKPPTGASPNGHLHGDESHDESHQTPIVEVSQETDKTPDFWSLSSEVRQKIFDQFYIERGLPPPPPGYMYRWKARDVPLLDENGNPVLHKKDEPIVEIRMEIGFAPTLEEFKKYNELFDAQGWAEADGDTAEAERLKAEMDALEASVQRMRPVHVMTSWIGAEAKSKASRVAREKLNAALREYGLAHLISPYE